MDKLNQLSLGEKLICGGAALMLIASFLPWYKVTFDLGIASGSISRNGWESPGALWSVLALLISLGLAGSIVAAKFGNVALPDLGSITWGQAYLGGAAAVAILIILKLINESSSISYGFFLGIIAAGAIAFGGYTLYSEEKSGVVRR